MWLIKGEFLNQSRAGDCDRTVEMQTKIVSATFI